MRCAHCNAIIPEGWMRCPRCGKDIQIVPDYNPLEDVLTQEVKGSVEDVTRQMHTEDVRNFGRKQNGYQSKATRVLSQEELNEIQTRRERAAKNRSRAEARRKQQERKKQLIRRRRKVLLILLLFLLLFGALFGYIMYQNSYAGKVAKGYDALQMKEYQTAEKYFKHAIGKNAQKPEAYSGLAETYMEQGEEDEAGSVFLSAIASYPSNQELYQAAIRFYEESKQLEKIPEILGDCEDEAVLSSLKAYISTDPVFSLDEGKYSEVQEVTLSASGETIYYTTDGSDPTSASTEYTEPILLSTEGKTQIKAIAYNEKKIPSLIVSKTYEIEFPVADAPVVTPSTGQYSTATQITITVPESYTAYYTIDGSVPTTESMLYTGPVEMPEGQTLFSAVLVSKTGKMTQITKRNYIYQPQ